MNKKIGYIRTIIISVSMLILVCFSLNSSMTGCNSRGSSSEDTEEVTPSLTECGDGFCTEGEDHVSCEEDCSLNCGNGECGEDENPLTCEVDCPSVCGDTLCSSDENAETCAEDCASICGDGIVSGSEECDDGNSANTDTCLNTCVSATCGDGFIQPGEGCDDGNDDDDDECTNSCAPPSCQDGIVQEGEECDDGNSNNTDDCLNTCVKPVCGDGYVWAGHEECDDGNSNNTDDCLDTCVNATCGDHFVWAEHEECDDGNNVINEDACVTEAETDYKCMRARCGDGYCAMFAFDDLWENAGNCPDDCPARCGDNICSPPGETARDCPGDCSASCGDGFCTHIETAEGCPVDCESICGDSFCTHDETSRSCAVDCEICGNRICRDIEKLPFGQTTCTEDCPKSPIEIRFSTPSPTNITINLKVLDYDHNTHTYIYRGDDEGTCPPDDVSPVSDEYIGSISHAVRASCPTSEHGFLNCRFSDTTVHFPGRYCYRFTGYSSLGPSESTPSENYIMSPISDDGLFLNLSLEQPRSIRMSWDRVPAATAYWLYSGPNLEEMTQLAPPIAPEDDLEYLAPPLLKLNEDRFFTISARYRDGSSSESSQSYRYDTFDSDTPLFSGANSEETVVGIDNNRMIVGGLLIGERYSFKIYSKRANHQWMEDTISTSIRNVDPFTSVDISGDYAVVGAGDSNGGHGKVIILHRVGATNWDIVKTFNFADEEDRRCGVSLSLITRDMPVQTPDGVNGTLAILCRGLWTAPTYIKGKIYVSDFTDDWQDPALIITRCSSGSDCTGFYPTHFAPETDSHRNFKRLKTNGYYLFLALPATVIRIGEAAPHNVGTVRQYRRVPGERSFEQERDYSRTGTAGNEFFGYSIDFSKDLMNNDVLAIGAPGTSRIYFHKYNAEGEWEYNGFYHDPDEPFFGYNLALTDNLLAVSTFDNAPGATFDGNIKIFRYASSMLPLNNLTEIESLALHRNPPLQFGSSIDMDNDGGYVVVGSPGDFFLY